MLVQGSDEWVEFRKSRIMSTDAAIIMGTNPYQTKLELFREKLGIIGPPKPNEAMLRGKALEETARDLFNKMMGMSLTPVVLSNTDNSWQASSLDGWDGKNLLEIKCPGPYMLAKCKSSLPPYWITQIQHQLCVSQVSRAFLFIFDGENGEIREIESEDHTEMLRKEKEFYDALLALEPLDEWIV